MHKILNNSVEHRHPSKRSAVLAKSMTVQENAFRATRDRYKYTDHAMIVISDNGMGFDVQYREYVFDLLKKITPASTGIGLGLPLSRKIVGNHGGTISVHSQPGKGTEVKITIPYHNDFNQRPSQ